MRKHMIALLGFLAGVWVYYLNEPAPRQAESHSQEITERMAAPSPGRAPTATPAAIPVSDPSPEISQEELREAPGLPRGMKFAPFVKAIAKEEYRKEMGNQLLEKNGFVFFHTQTPGSETANVVYDKRLDTFHPLTATIKLSGIDEGERTEILKEWTEFHYNKELEVQYLQSTHEALFDDFETLKKSGIEVSLEVIQAVYQSR